MAKNGPKKAKTRLMTFSTWNINTEQLLLKKSLVLRLACTAGPYDSTMSAAKAAVILSMQRNQMKKVEDALLGVFDVLSSLSGSQYY